MKTVLISLLILTGLTGQAQSIDPVSLLIGKLVKALDLKVQRQQNATIRLLTAQQVAEQSLSRTQLAAIADWEDKYRTLYQHYFRELTIVRPSVQVLPAVRQLFILQSQVIAVYRGLSPSDQQGSTAKRLVTMSNGILSALQDVLRTNDLMMRDGERVLRILQLRDGMQQCLEDMRQLRDNAERAAGLHTSRATDQQVLPTLYQRP